MKLLELFARLDELQKRLTHRSTGALSGIYSSAKADTPNLVFLPTDAPQLHDANSAIVMVIQPRKLKAVKDALLKKKYMARDITPEEDRLIDAISNLQNLRLGPEDIPLMANLPVRMHELQGRSRILKFITTDLGQPTGVYGAVFGDMPEEAHEDDYTPFHNARLFLPDNMAKRSRENAAAVLEQVFQNLSEEGEEDIFRGNIHFARLPSRVGGYYDVDHHDIKVNPNLKRDGHNVFTLLHEYGHKRMYETMDAAAHKAIEEKFNELRRGGERYGGDLDWAAQMADIADQIKPGMKINYRGRRKEALRMGDMWVKDIQPWKGQTAVVGANEKGQTRAMLPITLFTNPRKGWSIEGLEINAPKPTKGEKETAEWFPSEYSQTNWAEWWAELYAFLTYGSLMGAPAKWMRGMLGQGMEETVGANDGELNSDDDNPRPPPQRGNEEGNATWDWTDPYHHSGEQNAVNSRTP